MRLLGKKKLEKFKRKNTGNTILTKEINTLIADIENNNWINHNEIKNTRSDADCVHIDGFYFFDINSCKTLILIEFDDGEATVAWIGSHDDYERTFRNNRNTIRKWLKTNNWIE